MGVKVLAGGMKRRGGTYHPIATSPDSTRVSHATARVRVRVMKLYFCRVRVRVRVRSMVMDAATGLWMRPRRHRGFDDADIGAEF